MMMTASFNATARYQHPGVIREHQVISRLLAGILVITGCPEERASREAEALLLYPPLADQESGDLLLTGKTE